MENLFIPSSPNIYSHNGSEYKGNKCSALIPLYINVQTPYIPTNLSTLA